MSKIGEFRFYYFDQISYDSDAEQSGHLVVLRDSLDIQIAQDMDRTPIELFLRATRSNNRFRIETVLGSEYIKDTGKIISFSSREDALSCSDEINFRRNKLKN